MKTRYLFGVLNDDGSIDFEVAGPEFRAALNNCADVLCHEMAVIPLPDSDVEAMKDRMRPGLQERWAQEIARRAKVYEADRRVS